jgi:hypothetical protein
MYIPCMYVDEQCTHIVHTCYIHVYTSTCTWYRHVYGIDVYTCIYLLKKNLPDKTGEKAKWNFEKAHSILHKVSEIVLWGNSDNTSCQAPEVSTNVYVHACTLFIHVHTVYIHVCTAYIACMSVFPACPYRKHKNRGQPVEQQGCFYVYPAFPCSCWLPEALRDLAQGN